MVCFIIFFYSVTNTTVEYFYSSHSSINLHQITVVSTPEIEYDRHKTDRAPSAHLSTLVIIFDVFVIL